MLRSKRTGPWTTWTRRSWRSTSKDSACIPNLLCGVTTYLLSNSSPFRFFSRTVDGDVSARDVPSTSSLSSLISRMFRGVALVRFSTSHARLFSFEGGACLSILFYHSFQYIVVWDSTPTAEKPNREMRRSSYLMLTWKGFTALRAPGLVRFQHRKNTTFSASTIVFAIAGYLRTCLAVEPLLHLLL